MKMKVYLITFLIVFGSLLLLPAEARRKNAVNYSKDTKRLIAILRRQFKPLEIKPDDYVIKYYNAFSRVRKRQLYYGAAISRNNVPFDLPFLSVLSTMEA